MKKFKTIFKKNIVTTKTPLRISFSGGGTDMPYFYSKYNGITVSTSIDKFVYVTIKKHSNFSEKLQFDYLILINFEKFKKEFDLNDFQILHNFKDCYFLTKND